MSDWLHCNTCFQQPGDGRPYYLTGCGHVFCEMCKSKGWQERCLMCATPNPSALKLTAKLVPPVDTYFSDPIKLLKRICTDLKQLVAALEFQHHQRRKFVTQLQKTAAIQKLKVEKQEEELKAKLIACFTQYDKETSKLREENKYLKKLLSESHHQNRSPSRNRLQLQKGYGSPIKCNTMYKDSNMSSNVSPGNGMNLVTSGRVSVRTPPSGGKLGTVGNCTPPRHINPVTPKSVPHPISFHMDMGTPT